MRTTRQGGVGEVQSQSRSFLPLLIAGGIANFDRMTFGPMLVAMAATFHTSVGAASGIGMAYLVSYGATQPFWAVISDRIGRIRMITWSLVTATVASVLSAVAPTMTVLIVMRIIAGAAFGSVVSMVITHIGDTVSLERRQNVLSDLLAWLAIGTAIATLTAGVFSQYLHWRLVYWVCAIASAVLWLVVRTTYRDHRHVAIVVHPLKQLTAVLRSKWAVLVLALSLTEGFVLLGVLTVLPAVAQDRGATATAGGVIAATFGIAVLACTRLVKRVAHRPMIPMCIGAGCLAVAHIFPLLVGGPWILVLDATFLGGTWAAMHSSLQAWMTSTLADARAMAIGLMTAALFVGSGLGSGWAARMLDSGHSTTLFGIALLAAVGLAVVAVFSRSRYAPAV